MTNMRQQRQTDQRGVVSILVTMIMMIVITLIVIGFAQVARRNQRESLDRQLSTQAYYAAETGVNDAADAILGGSVSDLYTNAAYGTDCSAFTAKLGATTTLNAGTNTKYTCLLVNPAPTTLVASMGNGTGQVIWPINTDTALKELDISWAQDDTATAAKQAAACPTTGNRPNNAAGWPCAYAMLRVDIVKATDGSLSSTPLDSTANTSYIYATPGGASTGLNVFGSAPQVQTKRVQCSGVGGTCKLVLTFPGDSASYYARFSTLYQATPTLTVAGKVVGGTTANFRNAQAVVDSTGKAQDQLRRIQVRVSLTNSDNTELPPYGLQSANTICKYFTTAIGAGIATYPDSSAACKYQ